MAGREPVGPRRPAPPIVDALLACPSPRGRGDAIEAGCLSRSARWRCPQSSTPPAPRVPDPQPVRTPDLAVEAEHWRAGRARVAGGDGVGLGCLCGPVVAAAVILPPGCAMIEGVRDSKMLSAAQRQRLIEEIRAQALAVGVGAASVAEIERVNVRNAEILALR